MTEHLNPLVPDPELVIPRLAERIAIALSQRTPLDPKTVVTFNGERMAIEEVPSLQARWMLGYGHDPADVRQREHLPRGEGENWAYTPSTCLVADQGTMGVWVDTTHLACPGCGLDFT